LDDEYFINNTNTILTPSMIIDKNNFFTDFISKNNMQFSETSPLEFTEGSYASYKTMSNSVNYYLSDSLSDDALPVSIGGKHFRGKRKLNKKKYKSSKEYSFAEADIDKGNGSSEGELVVSKEPEENNSDSSPDIVVKEVEVTKSGSDSDPKSEDPDSEEDDSSPDVVKEEQQSSDSSPDSVGGEDDDGDDPDNNNSKQKKHKKLQEESIRFGLTDFVDDMNNEFDNLWSQTPKTVQPPKSSGNSSNVFARLFRESGAPPPGVGYQQQSAQVAQPGKYPQSAQATDLLSKLPAGFEGRIPDALQDNLRNMAGMGQMSSGMHQMQMPGVNNFSGMHPSMFSEQGYMQQMSGMAPQMSGMTPQMSGMAPQMSGMGLFSGMQNDSASAQQSLNSIQNISDFGMMSHMSSALGPKGQVPQPSELSNMSYQQGGNSTASAGSAKKNSDFFF
jgi:hypothetical protein